MVTFTVELVGVSPTQTRGFDTEYIVDRTHYLGKWIRREGVPMEEDMWIVKQFIDVPPRGYLRCSEFKIERGIAEFVRGVGTSDPFEPEEGVCYFNPYTREITPTPPPPTPTWLERNWKKVAIVVGVAGVVGLLTLMKRGGSK